MKGHVSKPVPTPQPFNSKPKPQILRPKTWDVGVTLLL